MHTLSIGTWLIHITSVIEWSVIIITIKKISTYKKYNSFIWLAFAMIPNLISGMAAITWHIFDSSNDLLGLVYLQALLTLIGNISLALSAYIIYNKRKEIIS